MSRSSKLNQTGKSRRASFSQNTQRNRTSSQNSENPVISTHTSHVYVEPNIAHELTLYFYNEILRYVIIEQNSLPGQEYVDSDEEPTYDYQKASEDTDSDNDDQSGDTLSINTLPRPSSTQDPLRKSTRTFNSFLASSHQILAKESFYRMSSGLPIMEESLERIPEPMPPEESSEALEEDDDGPKWMVKTNMEKEHVEIKYITGVIYKGELYRNMFEGRGIYQWPNGTYYEGQFQKGRISGYGKLTFSNQSYYSGELINCIPEGMGVFSLAGSPLQYSGHWCCGLPNGNGHLHYNEHDFYEGDWKLGKRNGPGLRVYASGSAYSGNWANGKQSGTGSMAFFNKDFYKGEWKDGLPHGYGEYTWNTRLNQGFTFTMEKQYLGNFAQGKRDGYGVQIFGMEGSKVVSLFEEDMKHGPGILVCGDGTTIERKPMFISDCPAKKRFNSVADNKSLQYSAVFKSHGRLSSGIRVRSAMNCLLRETFPDGDYERVSKIKQTFPSVDTNCVPVAIPMHATPKEVNIIHHVKKLLSEIGKPNIAIIQVDNATKISMRSGKSTPPQNIKETKSDRNMNPLVGERVSTLNMKPSVTSNSAANMTQQRQSKVERQAYKLSQTDTIISYPVPIPPPINSVRESRQVSIAVPQSKLSQDDRLESFGKTVFQNSFSRSSLRLKANMNNLDNESRLLSRSIANNYVYLRGLYQKYATLNLLESCCPEYEKPVMSRLHMWQFLRDIDIYRFGMSLYDINHEMLDIPNIHLDTEHDPFETIYFWQFIHLLLLLAYKIFLTLDFIEVTKDFGTYQALFNKLLEEVIKPNEGKFIGKALFDCKNILPIKGVYGLYTSVGEPHTARKLLSRICNKQGEEPLSCFFKKKRIYDTEAPHEHFVLNGSTILYLWVKDKDAWEVDYTKRLNKYAGDPFYTDLRKFRVLGPKKVMKCIYHACPNVKKDGNLVFVDYQIIFLEFYEILINLGNELRLYFENDQNDKKISMMAPPEREFDWDRVKEKEKTKEAMHAVGSVIFKKRPHRKS